MTVILLERIVKTSRECVTLRLLQDHSGLSIERQSIDAESTHSQLLPIKDLRDLREFIEADPYYTEHVTLFEQLYRAAEAALAMGGQIESQ